MDPSGIDPFLSTNSASSVFREDYLNSSPSFVDWFFNASISNGTGNNMSSSSSASSSSSQAIPQCPGPEMPRGAWEQAFYIFIYGLVSVSAIAGNAIVCFIVASFERMRKTENFFIFNLALTDMVMAFLCVPFSFVPTLIIGSYPFGLFMCKVMNYSQVVTVLVSSWTLVAISIERYFGVVFPFRPKMRRRKAVTVMCLTWVVALAVALPTVLFQVVVEHKANHHCVEKWPEWLAETSDDRNHISYVYGMILMTLQYFLPVGILTFTYSTIAVHIWRSKTPGAAMKDRDKKIKSEKMRMTKMMVVVVLLYIISWLPLNAYNVIADQYPAVSCCVYIHYIWFACHWLAMSHATLNPIIYFWMNSKFRSGFLYTLNFVCCCRRQTDEWLVERKLIGGYTQSTKKFSQVFNRDDSAPNGYSKTGTVLRKVDSNGRSVKEPKGRSVKELNGRSVKEPNGRSVQEPNGRSVKELNGRSVQEFNGRSVQEPNGRPVKELNVQGRAGSPHSTEIAIGRMSSLGNRNSGEKKVFEAEATPLMARETQQVALPMTSESDASVSPTSTLTDRKKIRVDRPPTGLSVTVRTDRSSTIQTDRQDSGPPSIISTNPSFEVTVDPPLSGMTEENPNRSP
ncbi:putative Neuropeptide Y receptor [Hypsibius exemplaris]|uniref:Neuropeptide Y receptor n=1 Tax=Hypsibius exemplaris TaxID=2072580 RepID=A0A1W0WKP0_HYPEX|nr:putative Neuropeptide Y receptor [Hypsibius exemplaris]